MWPCRLTSVANSMFASFYHDTTLGSQDRSYSVFLLLSTITMRPTMILSSWAFRPENSPALKKCKGLIWGGRVVSAVLKMKYDPGKQD